MTQCYRVTRTVTSAECRWLVQDVQAGDFVYSYDGCTYGCVSPSGVAVTWSPDRTPFFELPAEALEETDYRSPEWVDGYRTALDDTKADKDSDELPVVEVG